VLTYQLLNDFNYLLDFYTPVCISLSTPCAFPALRYDSNRAPLCWPPPEIHRTPVVQNGETLMLDIHGRSSAAPTTPLEFLRIELSPSSDGTVFVALTATVLDPDEPQLLDQEIVSDKITALDQLLQLLRTYVRITAQEAAPSRPLS
jgi:hypothetical protein